ERFGNIVRETEKGAVVEEMREPFVDIFEEAENIEVIAELPGVEEKDITYEIKDDVLLLKASGDSRKYSKEVLLPCKAAVLKTAYKNGVFKLTLNKEKEK
ncbi:MAG: Hsp20 family protein, partial [Euryarchaeota archaeon]|nr:Hsp20 family protein [Euryarchaeota archaeon]